MNYVTLKLTNRSRGKNVTAAFGLCVKIDCATVIDVSQGYQITERNLFSTISVRYRSRIPIDYCIKVAVWFRPGLVLEHTETVYDETACLLTLPVVWRVAEGPWSHGAGLP